MADVSHLEKMGRELKCPICLSLLKCAASITCNHVFCNECIVKCMKKKSNCPVCKMPFHRREIRPAPHMDNLVDIYKSMETASGVNMFMSECAAPSSQIPENLAETSIHVQNKPQWLSGNQIRSSFPSQKRVQVAHYPLPETPVHSSKTITKNSEPEHMPEECENTTFSAISNTDQTDRAGTCLSPFFWLRDDEDAENLSQLSEGTFETNGTPPAALSFSDVKDSDDEAPHKDNSQGESHENFPAVDLSDNGMLEWMPNHCSPKLCSNSVATKFHNKSVKETQPYLISHGRSTRESHPSVNADPLSLCQDNSLTSIQQLNPHVEKMPQVQNLSKRRNTRTNSQPTVKNLTIRASTHEVDGHLDSLDPVLKPHCNFPNSEETATKRQKRNQKSETTTKLVESIIDKHVNLESPNPLMKGKKCKSKGASDRCLRARKQNSKPAKIMGLEDLSENDTNKNNVRDILALGTQKRKSQKDRLEAEKISKCLDDGHDTNTSKPLRDLFEVEDCPTVPSLPIENNIVSGEANNSSKTRSLKTLHSLESLALGLSRNATITLDAPSNYVQTKGNVLGATGEDKNNSTVLEKSLSQNQQNHSHVCAFCQSAENSTPYGKMILYIDGRPVSTNHNEGSNSVHCHLICAEWAPNVYFKDDTAMNLKAELARSRRISCSCCGVKGAALGCYHKSCHRSFHVPCAKLMPECRWDSENYVMLCPLHASSKLPCEMPGSPRKRKRASKDKSMQESVETTNIPKADWKGDSHTSPEKIVLCCSSLAADDKDIVAQFKMLSWVRESNTWSSNVTHVIASVDENEACKRTLKVLMGILEGKWILSTKWIKACVDAKRLIDEQQYEITSDIHGIKGGPRLGRLRVLEKEPKLFHGLEFYLFGDFAASYKGYLTDLIIAAGGTILHRKPIVANQSRPSTFIIYNIDDPSAIRQAHSLANSTGSKAATNAWILNSIAASQLQNTE